MPERRGETGNLGLLCIVALLGRGVINSGVSVGIM